MTPIRSGAFGPFANPAGTLSGAPDGLSSGGADGAPTPSLPRTLPGATAVSRGRRGSRRPGVRGLPATWQPYLLALAATVALGAFATYDVVREQRIAVAHARSGTANLARLLEDTVRQSLQRADLALAEVHDAAADLPRGRWEGHPALLSQLRQAVSGVSPLREVRVLAPDGRTLASATRAGQAPWAPQPVPLAARPWIAQALANGADASAGAAPLIGPAEADGTGRWLVPVVRHVRDVEGQSVLLLGLLEAARLQAVFEALDTGTNGFVSLFQSDGWLLVTAPPTAPASLARRWHDTPMFSQHMPAAPTGTVQQVVVRDGTERIYSYRVLADYPLVVATGISLTDALADWRVRVRGNLALLAGVALVLLAAAHLLTRHLRRRQMAEATLADTARRTRAIVDHVADGIVTFDRRGRVESLNLAAEAMFGLRAAMQAGRPVSELLPALQPAPGRAAGDAVSTATAAAAAGASAAADAGGAAGAHQQDAPGAGLRTRAGADPGANLASELDAHLTPYLDEPLSATHPGRALLPRPRVEGRRADGSRLSLELSITRVDRGDDEPSFIALVRDIGGRLKADAVLAEARAQTLASERFLRELADNIPVRIAYVDRNRRLRFVNQANLDSLGLPRESVLGEATDALPLAPALQQALAAALQGQRQRLAHDEAHAEGSAVIESDCVPDLAPDGSVRGCYLVSTDVTQRHQQQRRIEQALTEREMLLREVYHRVKNNLQVVQSLLSLQRRALPEGEARIALDDSVQRVRAMALVHEQLYQAGSLASVSLVEYTRELLRQIGEANDASRRGIALLCEVVPLEVGLEVSVPYGLLVTELVGNSLKHGFPDGRGGHIRLTLGFGDPDPADAPGAQTGVPLLRVADDGVSLPSGFDLMQTRSLGLQLAASLSEQLGGQLMAQDAQGAVFTTALPRLRPAVQPAAVAST